MRENNRKPVSNRLEKMVFILLLCTYVCLSHILVTGVHREIYNVDVITRFSSLFNGNLIKTLPNFLINYLGPPHIPRKFIFITYIYFIISIFDGIF